MREKINNFYLNKYVLLTFAVLALLSWLGWAISVLVTGSLPKLVGFAFIFFAITLGMTISYLKGATSLQKMLFGSLLIFLVVDFVELVDLYASLELTQFVIIFSIMTALLVIFFISHMLQQLDHVGKSIIIVINQCCGLIILLCVVYLAVCLAQGIATANDFTFCFAVMFTLFLMISMETRISRYKQIRAENMKNGTWNEETRAEAKKLFKI